MTERALAVALLALFVAPAAPAQNADLHELQWYVHVDMVTGSEPLAFWQAFIDQATAQSATLLKGNQGSVGDPDEACCTELTVAVVGTYGASGDGLDTPSGTQLGAMRAAIQGGDPGGSVAFLVSDISNCGGSANAIGCTNTPFCDTNANDDPPLELMASVEAMQDDGDGVPEGVGGLAQTLAHERGHTACLLHVSANPCQLMQPAGSGGCLSPAECVDLREARTTTAPGNACACHSGGGYVADGSECSEGATVGLCSGGVCAPGTAWGGRVEVLAAGAPEAVEISAPLDETTDDLLRISDLPGGWADTASFPDDVQGLAYDADRDVLWGVIDNGANDQVVAIDPATGAITSTLATLTGHPNVIALAFHPGATTAGSDDHLLANSANPEGGGACDLGAACFGDLIEIDPATGAFAKLGDMHFGFAGGLRGMAYDSTNGVLYGTGFGVGGLYEFTNLSCNATVCSCSGGFCTMLQTPGVSIPRVVSGLAYSADTHRLYVVGTQAGSQLFHQSIDADTFAVTEILGVDGYTPGGLAARPLPMPEPGAAALATGGLGVLALARRRAQRQA